MLMFLQEKRTVCETLLRTKRFYLISNIYRIAQRVFGAVMGKHRIDYVIMIKIE